MGSLSRIPGLGVYLSGFGWDAEVEGVVRGLGLRGFRVCLDIGGCGILELRFHTLDRRMLGLALWFSGFQDSFSWVIGHCGYRGVLVSVCGSVGLESRGSGF